MALLASVVICRNSCSPVEVHLTENANCRFEGQVIDSSELFNQKRQEWQDFYNYAPPHGSLGARRPASVYRRRRPRVKAMYVS